ncbi:MAG: UDP-3-O-(3-hydroxymyristoyl)glucosamine N-acyltransferase [Bacteroidetes bacterium]|nr:UDP-3-O-(3-hydroxymyristoyl)glucosamine N-acyltransferase [Bacteroidota bacterium]MBP6426321.1 UDP-3-O-(3-hydroxymyristoyl)glucosamine N-acyltransferase [Bacteroidia bacterium]MBK8365801.1 UDP-3-O-(3-hydroxymyristoyl)glucosamine N-acyltransferase [Bacteroidota bacterium]MBK9412497.1 UDP-3-O-(3-hydroxymyristoyl)glucosamine N-acyltransferase [Bacteroidota bacterium]MBL0032200.1 UDP-3-O-(3-hydroxymyristoyl)glucosamine N-acyltransferase [Bacteroidota bacterium]
MEFTARQIADLLKGKIEGKEDAKVYRLDKIEEGAEGGLTFLANPKYTPFIYTTKASVVIVDHTFVAEQTVSSTMIRVENAYQSFVQLLEIYNQIQRDKKGIEQPSFVSTTATLGKDIYIGAFAYIGNNVKVGNNVKIYPQVYIGDNVSIGDNTTLFAGARIYSDCIIGKDCTIHSGTIIGADGFGFTPNSANQYNKVAQIGNVILEDHVDVGANTTIDRATLGSTIIRKGVKLDNLIQIAHNVEIGENTVIAAQTGVAGSTKIGKDCMIGGQVGIVGHITIADKVKIAAQSGIGSSITNEGEILQGSPAFGIGDYKRTYVVFRKLPALEKRIQELEQMIADLKQIPS